MKKIILSILFPFLAVSVCLSQEMISMDVLSMKEEADSLSINYRIYIAPYALESSKGLRINPSIQTQDSVLMLPQVTLLGKNKQKVVERYANNTLKQKLFVSTQALEDTTDYFIRIPYELWMDSAQFCIRQEVAGYRGNRIVTRYQLGGQVELEAKEPYAVNPQVAFIVPKKEEKRRRRQGKAYLDFQAGRSVIVPNFRRNPEELQKIDDAVKDVVNNNDAVLQGLYVEGFASPEGSFALNERLSHERATALKEYIRNKFSLNDNLFKVSSSAEDWQGLEVLVKASDLKNQDKILEIITSMDAPDKKELALKRVNGGTSYRIMLKDMFPELRRVEYQIDYTVRDYGVEESRSLLETRPGDLSQLELYNLALDFGKNSKEYRSILMELIPLHFNENKTAANNAAAAMLENKEMVTAARYLEKAGDSAEALNNQGVVLLLEGELDKAEEFFLQAQKAGNEAAVHNLKEIELKRQDNKKMERYANRK